MIDKILHSKLNIEKYKLNYNVNYKTSSTRRNKMHKPQKQINRNKSILPLLILRESLIETVFLKRKTFRQMGRF
jgi:hypothetical protein